MPRPTLIERAAKYVAVMPAAVSGGGGHNATFAAACALVKGFGLTVDQARPLMMEFNGRCDPPWSEREIEHKLTQADTTADTDPRGYLAGAGQHEVGEAATKPRGRRPEAPNPVYDPALLKRTAAQVGCKVDLLYLANRSVVDPATVTTEGFLRALVPAGQKVLIFNVVNSDGAQYSQGEALWPDEEPPHTGKCGVWWLPQPVDGQYRIQPGVDKQGKAKTSRRAGNCVQSFPWLVIESDEAPVLEWMAVLVQLPLRIAAIYTSGGRSVHALVRIDATTKGHWDVIVKGDDLQEETKGMAAGMKALILNGADKGVFSAVRLTRLPGCMREGKIKEVDGRTVYQRFERPEPQKLLYLNPEPDGRPICELMLRRDVESHWYDLAAHDYPDLDEARQAEVRRAAAYYAPVSKRCRLAAQVLRGGGAK